MRVEVSKFHSEEEEEAKLGTGRQRGLSVRWRDVRARVGKAKYEALHGVSGVCPGGTLTAILGPSGSGKSTLLGVLSHRFERRARSSGEVLYDGAPWRKGLKRLVGYVEQDDCLLGDARRLRRRIAPSKNNSQRPRERATTNAFRGLVSRQSARLSRAQAT